MPDSDLLAELKRIEDKLLRSGMTAGELMEFIAAVPTLLPRIIAALTPGGAVVAVHTASEADHERPPGSERP